MLTYKVLVFRHMSREAISKASRFFRGENWIDHVFGEGPRGFMVQMPNEGVVCVHWDGFCEIDG